MDLSDLGKTIAGFAPLLGSVVGGPAGGAIGSVIASAFGVEDNPQAISQAIKNDPEAAIKLKKIELDNKTELERIAVQKLSIELSDVQNARKNNTHSRMPAIITIVMTLLASCYGAALFLVEIPLDNKDMINYFGGQLIALWFASIVYWTGTTRSSANKDLR